MKKKIFLISPVRQCSVEQKKEIEGYVRKLEEEGHKIYWPKRDTNQEDYIGLDICLQNGKEIILADEIHVWWDPTSSGSKFDFGVAFACLLLKDILHKEKNIILANKDEIKATVGKSFENVLLILQMLEEKNYIDEYLEKVRREIAKKLKRN